ncbi:MAG TPA: HD domain-containing protein [Planctomycetes bacterium]|nr:HD domain-containing protein [Planctomycetota bacterium]
MTFSEKDVDLLFGKELELLGDKDLAGKVRACWVEAARLGGWKDAKEIEEMPFTLLLDTRGIGFAAHTRAVVRGAVGLAEALALELADKFPRRIDRDVLVAGALLHDVGKLLEIEKDGKGGYRRSRNGKLFRHPISGAMLAHRMGLPDEVVHCIAVHSREGEGFHRSLEAQTIHDADFATFDPLKLDDAGKLL